MYKQAFILWYLYMFFGLIYSDQLIDLSYDIDNQTYFSPIFNSPFTYTNKIGGITAGGFFLAAHEFKTPEHLGTHIDAPYHFCETCATLEKIPIENFIVNGFLIDISKKCANNRDYQMTVDDIKLSKNDMKLLRNRKNVLIIRTGWGKYWGDRLKYVGSNESDYTKFHFPGVGKDAAQYLVDSKLFVGIGLDVASLDAGISLSFEAHQIVLPAGMYVLENLANLDQITTKSFELFVFPIKLRGGSGGPSRVLARITSSFRDD